MDCSLASSRYSKILSITGCCPFIFSNSPAAVERPLLVLRFSTGTKAISTLRQMIANDMGREGWSCLCIRCREVKSEFNATEKIRLVRREYQASNGTEIFLSFENESKTKLFSLLRLRIPAKDFKPASPILKNAALIREIHTYGLQTQIAKKSVSAQHTGLGKKLIQEAEKIAKNEFKAKKIAAISGIGARAYWRKSGYKLKESYMVTSLR